MDRMKARNAAGSPILIAIGPKDKENLSSPSIVKSKKTLGSKKTSFKIQKNKNMINLINNVASDLKTTKREITAADLTTTGNPGESYWEQLSESRRVALESALKENTDLHGKVMELEYENTRLKSMLSEAKTSITLLTELLGENESGDEDDENQTEEGDCGANTTLDDVSFTSI